MEIELRSLSTFAGSLGDIFLAEVLIEGIQKEGDVKVGQSFAVVAASLSSHTLETSSHDGESLERAKNDEDDDEEIVHEHILELLDFAVGGISELIPIASIFNDAFAVINAGDNGKVFEAEESNLTNIVDET